MQPCQVGEGVASHRELREQLHSRVVQDTSLLTSHFQLIFFLQLKPISAGRRSR